MKHSTEICLLGGTERIDIYNERSAEDYKVLNMYFSTFAIIFFWKQKEVIIQFEFKRSYS